MKSDRELQQDVIGELVRDVSIRSDRIAVSVEAGVVTLGGVVASLAEKEAVRRAAQRVCDIRNVVVALDVIGPACPERTDAEIARAANAMLAWSLSVPRDRVVASVKNGCVTLSGRVERASQREAAASCMRSLLGVRGVLNSIEVDHERPAPSGLDAGAASDLGSSIRSTDMPPQ